jgi:hypothetical protein
VVDEGGNAQDETDRADAADPGQPGEQLGIPCRGVGPGGTHDRHEGPPDSETQPGQDTGPDAADEHGGQHGSMRKRAGHEGPPVGGGAGLTPDGRRAAFPQRDRVVVVDLTSGATNALEVPGFNETVRWRNDGIMVNQNGTAVAVSLAAGEIRPAPYPFHDVVSAPTATPESPVIGLVAAEGRRPARVRTWPAAGDPVDLPVAGHGAMAQWARTSAGTGWAAGDRVAGAARLPDRPGSTEVLVVDAGTGSTVRMLTVPCTPPHNPTQVCAGVAGWLGGTTVLVSVYEPEQRLLGWNIETGRLALITEIRPRPVAVVWSGNLA